MTSFLHCCFCLFESKPEIHLHPALSSPWSAFTCVYYCLPPYQVFTWLLPGRDGAVPFLPTHCTGRRRQVRLKQDRLHRLQRGKHMAILSSTTNGKKISHGIQLNYIFHICAPVMCCGVSMLTRHRHMRTFMLLGGGK